MIGQDWIKASLKARGYKLKDVAEVLKITPPRVSDIIKGTREVQADEILPLAKLLGLTPTALLKSLEKGSQVQHYEELDYPRISVEGQLTGIGEILPLTADFPFSTVSIPPDAKVKDGLRCFVMGDNSLEQEIHPGSLIIAADPRDHYFPIIPGSILLINIGEDKLVPRYYHRTDDGVDWLIPCPLKPNPAFECYQLEMFANEHTQAQNAGPLTVSIDDIAAAVLWVHRRYN